MLTTALGGPQLDAVLSTAPLDPALLTSVGWCTAMLLAALQLRAHRRLVLVARASHELRGPLCAARLGLEGLVGESARAVTIDLELARAGRALDDLAAAPAGRGSPERVELVDLALLAADHAPSWQALARAHGAHIRFEPPDEAPTRLRLALDDGKCRVAGAGDDGARESDVTQPHGNGRSEIGVVRDGGAGARGVGRGEIAAPGDDRLRFVAGGPRPLPAQPATAVVGDALRLAQASTNLVANALEHGGGDVRIRVRAVDDRVRLEVADDGPGLPAPVAVLVHAARARSGRRGHGLAIAAAIAERHGGRIVAEGSRVVLDLPAAGQRVEHRRLRRRPRRVS